MTDLLDYRDRFPDSPGYKGTDTSKKAAESVKQDAPLLRRMCLDVIAKSPDGMTADEAAEALGESVLSIRPRFSELKATGEIRDTGFRRRNISGRHAVVWAADV